MDVIVDLRHVDAVMWSHLIAVVRELQAEG